MDPNDKARLLKKQQETYKKIGTRLRAFRKSKGYSTFEKFANDHGIERSYYGKHEQGRDMRISSLVKILDLMDVSLEEFFGEGFGEL